MKKIIFTAFLSFQIIFLPFIPLQCSRTSPVTIGILSSLLFKNTYTAGSVCFIHGFLNLRKINLQDIVGYTLGVLAGKELIRPVIKQLSNRNFLSNKSIF